MATTSVSTYEALPYQSMPLAYTHPDRLATIATLFGMQPPAVHQARILELGCGDGHNLTAIATSLPEAECVGVDLSVRHIEKGQQRLAQLGLTNIRLEQQDLMQLTLAPNQFDYIIVHGLYSWVNQSIRDRIMQLCQTGLSPQGVAYISYNTLPGWNIRSTLRALLQYHTQALTDPEQRTQYLRHVLHGFAAATEEAKDTYSQLLHSELQAFKNLPESYLFHEFLELDNHPVYFNEFMSHAHQHELAYLGDVYFYTMLPSNISPQAAAMLKQMGGDVLFQEQQLDFLRNRHFRHTLLCRQGITLDRTITPNHLTGLRFASPLAPHAQAPQQFSSDRGSVETASPLIQSALTLLQAQWPKALPFAEVLAQARAHCGEQTETDSDMLAAMLLRCYSAGIIEAHVTPSPFVLAISDKPAVMPLAREEAKQGRYVTNLRCELVHVENIMALKLIPYLDGNHSQTDLLKLLHEWLNNDEIQLNFKAEDGSSKMLQLSNAQREQILQGLLQESLGLIARGALLVM